MNRILVHIARCTLRRLNELIIRGSVLFRRMIAKYSNRKMNYKIKKSFMITQIFFKNFVKSVGKLKCY